MNRSLRTLCALLVVVAALPVSTPLVGAIHADEHEPVAPTAQVQPLSERNTTSVLLLGGETSTGFGQSTVDIAPTVSATHGVIGVTLRDQIVRERLDATTTADRRRQVLRQETERLADDVERLQQTEQRALTRYERGEISAEELIRTLAVVDAEARRAEELVSLLQDEVSQVRFLSATEETLQTLQVELATLHGPVRAHARAVYHGEESATRIHVTVSDGAVALSTIRGNSYLREATDPRNVDGASSDQFASESEVIDRISELYPWAWGSESSAVRTYTNFENGVYRIDVDHSHGRLTGYLDGSSKNIFSEVQVKSLSRVPSGQPTEAVENQTTLRVNQSFVGGPVEVAASEATTGTPVDGTVYVDGQRVGQTNDGRFWVVGPGGQYDVTVQTERGNVTVTAQALT